MMETEIWPRFIREAKRSGARIAIVNGRLSQRSFKRYSLVRSFVSRVLGGVDLALMQEATDAEKIQTLGMQIERVHVTGNLKFDNRQDEAASGITNAIGSRFGLTEGLPLIVAASTHDPEERIVIESLKSLLRARARLMIAPRHPERFAEVGELMTRTGIPFVRRTDQPRADDKRTPMILLDSIGELRAVFPFASIVFVGGSLIPHGGQSILEPAASGTAIVTGPYTANFTAAVGEFLAANALIQLTESDDPAAILRNTFEQLLDDSEYRLRLASNASAVIERHGSAATSKTLGLLVPLIEGSEGE
jgi:3-deoxy-D-manno-octulosonic-acid transferase